MNKTQKKQRMAQIVSTLEGLYPSAECALEYGGEAWRLMVMGRLSAQCTDARVNQVCRELFERFPTLDALADAPLDDIANIVRSCGLWKTKSGSALTGRPTPRPSPADISMGKMTASAAPSTGFWKQNPWKTGISP